MSNITIPQTPSGSAYYGLLNVYKITGATLFNLNKYLWSKDFFDALTKINVNPIDNIVSVHRIPFTVTSRAQNAIILGNVVTSIQGNVIYDTWQSVTSKHYNINKPFGDYRDYMCRIKLYLPFVGVVDVSPSDLFINDENDVYISYHVNVVTGGFIAFLVNNGNVITQYSGNCSMPLPVSGSNFSSVINNSVSSGLNAVGSALSIPFNPVGGVISAAAGAVGFATSLMSNAPTTMNMKTDNSNSFGVYPTPYLRIYKPRRIDNPQKKYFTGLPSGVGVTALAQCARTGLVKTLDFKFSGSGCTDWEKSEVERILNTEGVIL